MPEIDRVWRLATPAKSRNHAGRVVTGTRNILKRLFTGENKGKLEIAVAPPG
jgi:hypothetical protein